MSRQVTQCVSQQTCKGGRRLHAWSNFLERNEVKRTPDHAPILAKISVVTMDKGVWGKSGQAK